MPGEVEEDSAARQHSASNPEVEDQGSRESDDWDEDEHLQGEDDEYSQDANEYEDEDDIDNISDFSHDDASEVSDISGFDSDPDQHSRADSAHRSAYIASIDGFHARPSSARVQLGQERKILDEDTAFSDRHPLTIHEIHSVAAALKRVGRLPDELITYILGLADYTDLSVARGFSARPERIRATSQAYAASAYLVSESIRFAGVGRTVSSAVLRVKASDQGWADPESAAYSWFEVFKVAEGDETPDRPVGLKFAWNRIANREEFVHTYKYNRAEAADPHTEPLCDFFESLQEGDRVGIAGKAQYPGWQNNVRAASIQIFGTAYR